MPRPATKIHVMNDAGKRAAFLAALTRERHFGRACAATGERMRDVSNARYWSPEFGAACAALVPTADWRRRPRASTRPGWRQRFFAALSQHGTIARAAREAGIGRTTVYHYQATDPSFAAECAQAVRWGEDAKFGQLIYQAIHGVETTRTARDGTVTKIVKSDWRLMFRVLEHADKLRAQGRM